MKSVPAWISAGLVALVAACALLPAAAQADPYTVDFCKRFDPLTAPAGSTIVPTPFGGGLVNNCAVPDINAGLQIAGPSSVMQPAQTEDISLTVPGSLPGLRIDHVLTQWRTEAVIAGGGTGLMGIYSDVRNTVPDVQYAAGTAPTDDLTMLTGTRDVKWDLFCGAAPCQFTTAQPLTLVRAKLTLNESVVPVLDVTGGTLLGTGAKAGSRTVIFTAGDVDSGVASVTVALDATVAGTIAYSCPHTGWSACPNGHTGDVLQVDTIKVPDGNHEVLVTVRDAANNAVTRSFGTIAVANAAAGGPGGADGAGDANGGNASRQAKLSAAFTSTKKRTRTLRFGSTPTARGTLLDEHGQPIAGATIAILERPQRSGAQSVQVATVPTGADGRFSAKLRSGPSRRITFAYTAFAGDAKPATTATLNTRVPATISAAAHPRVPRAGVLMTLSGRLRFLPRSGVEVAIQAHNNGRWQVVAVVKTTRGGAYRWRNRFARSQAGRRFALRARVSSPIYPFATGVSKAVGVRVRA